MINKPESGFGLILINSFDENYRILSHLKYVCTSIYECLYVTRILNNFTLC